MNNNELSISQQRLQESLVPIIKDKPNYVRPASFTSAICKSTTTLLSVQKQGGLRSLVGWVKGRLIELFTFLGVFDIVTEFQVQMLATRLCTKYYYWTTTELDYAFIRIMEGKYGKLYQYKHEYEDKSTATTINPQDLMVALDSYEKELLLERGKVEAERRKEEERLKAIEDAKETSWHRGMEKLLQVEGFRPRYAYIAIRQPPRCQ
ncbi:MAG: hypothetical protein ACLR8W_11145 [Segatella copri]